MANRGYDVDHRTTESIEIAQRWLPSTHLVVPRSELLRIADVAKAAGCAEQAERAHPAIQAAYFNGRARGAEMAVRLRLHWWIAVAIAFMSFTGGRLFGAGL